MCIQINRVVDFQVSRLENVFEKKNNPKNYVYMYIFVLCLSVPLFVSKSIH